MFLVALAIAPAARAMDLVLTVPPGADCPARADVVRGLGALIPELRFVEKARHGVKTAEILDLGERYRISTDVDKVVLDPLRRCTERARTSVLVIALSLDAQPTEPLPPLIPPPLVQLPPADPLPRSYIDRPLVLARGRALLSDEVTVGFLQAGGLFEYGTVETVSFDIGVGGRTQLGFEAAVPLIHDTTDYTFLARGQVLLHPNVALRVAAGIDRSPQEIGEVASLTGAITPTLRDTISGFASLGLRARWRLTPRIAITVGDYGERTEWLTEYDGLYSAGLVIFSRALFAFRASGNGTRQISFCLPGGVLIQAHRMVALHFQAGLQIGLDDSSADLRIAIPLSADLIVSPHKRIDVGLGIDLPMSIDNPLAFIDLALFLRFRI